MKCFDLENSLGCLSDSEEIKSLLTAYSVPNARIKLKRGENTAYVECEQHGIAWSFDVVESRSEPRFAKLPEGALVLSAVFLFAEGQQGNSQYQGRLPMSLNFEDSRNAVHGRLGAPNKTNEFFPIDRWDLEDHQLAVNFNDEGSRIEYITVQLPMD